MSLPLDFQNAIAKAVERGSDEIRKAGFVSERPDVAFAVERHRWAWKPNAVRVLLVAESHVYTSEEDLRIRIQRALLPAVARDTPEEFVRLVYCLGYGETWLLDRKPKQSNAGTWQFWNIFGRLAGTGRQPTSIAARAARLGWKLDTLSRLRDRGVWLIDSSLHGVYAPGARRIPRALTAALHRTWWEHYGRLLFQECSGAHRCVIGKTTAAALTEIGALSDNWIYQPQAERNVRGPEFEHGWPELMAAVGTGESV